MSTAQRDILERAAVAFFEGAIGGLVITQYADKTMWLAALSAGVSAALSVIKSVVATQGGTGSASLSKKV